MNETEETLELIAVWMLFAFLLVVTLALVIAGAYEPFVWIMLLFVIPCDLVMWVIIAPPTRDYMQRHGNAKPRSIRQTDRQPEACHCMNCMNARAKSVKP